MSDQQPAGTPEAVEAMAVALHHARWFAAAAMLRAHAAEIGRLRAIIRVNGVRAGASHAEIDEVIHGKQS